MNPIKRLFGMAPTPDETGRGYIPSPLGRLLGVANRSGYEPVDFAGRAYGGDKKVLVLCTEERYFEMTNGALFSTGQNALETAVPLMHLTAAGFGFDVVTPTGAPAVIEEWSAPSKDEAVLGFLADHRVAFDRPLSLRELVAEGALDDDSPYVALFLPGGHGAMVGLPEDPNVGVLLRWVEASGRYLVAVCHGPAAMLAATIGHEGPHPYAGYEMAAFPDGLDQRSPSLGYLPGDLPWLQCERLEAQGIRIVNDKANGTTHIDRKLYSGDSPKACDQLGKSVAEALLADAAIATQHTAVGDDGASGGVR
jgi:molecular chaperone Hsp31 and glyoxalase 3